MTTAVTNMGYRELDPDQYSGMQNTLLKVKGSTSQREFLEALKDADTFVALIEDKVHSHDGLTLPTFDEALTESSFKEPTEDQEARMYAMWHDTPPRIACRVSFWASVTLEHIREGKISEATWLAANGGITETGGERIDRALLTPPEDVTGNKVVDDCVRTVFRRMSGLPAARGNRSVFVNPSFGRGWWRERIVASILGRSEPVEDRAALLEVVRRNQQYWENLVTMIVSRGSVFGSADVQTALINSLAKHFRLNPDTPLRTAATLNIALRRFSNLAASREIGVLTFDEISTIADDLLNRVRLAYSTH